MTSSPDVIGQRDIINCAAESDLKQPGPGGQHHFLKGARFKDGLEQVRGGRERGEKRIRGGNGNVKAKRRELKGEPKKVRKEKGDARQGQYEGEGRGGKQGRKRY